MLGHLNYIGLTAEKRDEVAAKARTQIKAALSNPALTEEQRAVLQERLTRLNQWAAGSLPSSATLRASQNQTVSVAEGVSVGEKV
jgi:hypothetical protein